MSFHHTNTVGVNIRVWDIWISQNKEVRTSMATTSTLWQPWLHQPSLLHQPNFSFCTGILKKIKWWYDAEVINTRICYRSLLGVRWLYEFVGRSVGVQVGVHLWVCIGVDDISVGWSTLKRNLDSDLRRSVLEAQPVQLVFHKGHVCTCGQLEV